MLLGLVLALINISFAEAPEWGLQSFSEDPLGYIVVGRGSGHSEADAFEAARNDAIQTTIREIFGFSTSIYKRATESNLSADFMSFKSDKSKAVRLKNFKETKAHSTDNEGQYSVWVQFTYAKSDALIELERLSNVPDNEDIPISLIQIQGVQRKLNLKAQGSYKKSDLPSVEQLFREFKACNNSFTLSAMGIEYQRQLFESVGIKFGVSPGSLVDKEPHESKTRYGNEYSYDLNLGINFRYELLFLSLFGGPTKAKSESKIYTHYGYEVGFQIPLAGNYGMTTSYLQKFAVDRGPLKNAYDGIFNLGLLISW